MRTPKTTAKASAGHRVFKFIPVSVFVIVGLLRLAIGMMMQIADIPGVITNSHDTN